MKNPLLTLALLAPLAWAETSPSLLEQADQQFTQGDLPQAEATYQQAIAATPKSLEARMRLGGFYLSQHRNREAVAQFQQALGVDPQSARAFAALGIAYWHDGRYPLAEAALNEALKIQPDLPEAAKLLKKLAQKNAAMEAPHHGPKNHP